MFIYVAEKEILLGSCSGNYGDLMFGAPTYFIFTYVLTCSGYITHLGLASCMLGGDSVYIVICIAKLHDLMNSLLYTAMYLCTCVSKVGTTT